MFWIIFLWWVCFFVVIIKIRKLSKKNGFVKYKKIRVQLKSFYCLNLLVLNQPVYFLSVRGNLWKYQKKENRFWKKLCFRFCFRFLQFLFLLLQVVILALVLKIIVSMNVMLQQNEPEYKKGDKNINIKIIL